MDDLRLFWVAYALSSSFILLSWGAHFLRPLRILAVAIHELGHAAGVVLGCGCIHGIGVNRFEGGYLAWSVHRFMLCTQCTIPLIMSLGYLAAALVGGSLILSFVAEDALAPAIEAFSVLTLISSVIAGRRPLLRFDAGWLFVYGALGLVCASALREESSSSMATLARLYGLFSGVMLGLYAIYDVFDDTVWRQIPTSDASQFAVATCNDVRNSRCVGLVWLVICIALHAASVATAGLLLN